LVGINYLEKIQLPTLPSLFGAMLADVDYVLMGAGIPQSIPGVLDRLSKGEAVELALRVVGAGLEEEFVARFNPAEFSSGGRIRLKRPKFLAIIASATLATMLSRKASGRVDGFVVEGPTAGGHNAPPRGLMQLNQRGEPIYGERDIANVEAIRSLGLPFWLAGSYGSPARVAEALDAGAAGVQVGTAFAFCEESGLRDDIKQRVLRLSRHSPLDVYTDAVASPAGFPFKVLRLDDSLSEPSLYEHRVRYCDLGYLCQTYRKQDGTMGWRCPAERPESYARKGGNVKDTIGRKCLCNCLLANVGLGQVRRNGEREMPMVTCGDDTQAIALLAGDRESYSASAVVEYLLSAVGAERLSAKTESEVVLR
jgi:nitronate monooxygenase